MKSALVLTLAVLLVMIFWGVAILHTQRQACMTAVVSNAALVQQTKTPDGKISLTVPGYEQAKQVCKDWGI